MRYDDLEKTNDHVKENAMVRYGRGILLILTMSINGLITGAWLSAQFIVEEKNGLAGGAEVAIGGLATGIIFIVFSIIMIQRLRGRLLFQITAASLLIAIILMSIIASRV
ncbi:MAG: hypothetical protein KDF58_11535 [Alphaproteobacteria bacterium]|nr:hypothetical protein [Alphaproteobacteria bacterium]